MEYMELPGRTAIVDCHRPPSFLLRAYVYDLDTCHIVKFSWPCRTFRVKKPWIASLLAYDVDDVIRGDPIIGGPVVMRKADEYWAQLARDAVEDSYRGEGLHGT